MKKGFIFSTDAIMGMAIIVTLLSGIVIIGFSDTNQGAKQNLLYTTATDAAFIDYYLGGTTQDIIPDSREIYCKEIYHYTIDIAIPGGDVELKVRKCSSLG